MTDSEEDRHGAWRIAAQVFRGASPRVKTLAAVAAVYLLAVTCWIALAFGWSAWRYPQLWGGLAATVAALLIGWTYGLFTVAQDGTWAIRWRWSLPTRAMNRMLLAVPTMVFVSAVLATAAFVAILPLAVERPIYWIAVAGTGAMILAASRAIGGTTRFLYAEARAQSATADRAKGETAAAQLVALQAQMHPHFLFNALNTIAGLIRIDPARAETTVERLAHILRRTLDRSRQTAIPLEEELDFLRAYLDIEKARFGERLRIEWDVDPAALREPIPPMTLQPLVENAIKHGIGGRLEGGRVRISVRRDAGRLRLEVTDDGVGLAQGGGERTGLGNVRERLERVYGPQSSLRLESGDVGARTIIELPVDGSGTA